jgi:cytochrome c biogenesis protein CcdA
MLPSFVSYLLGAGEPGFEAAPLPLRAARALLFGATATLGFVTVFAAVGAVVALGGRAIFALVPLATVVIGVILIGLGLALLLGRAWHVALPVPLPAAGLMATRPGTAGLPAPGPRAMFLYGVGYATASLSCTLPVFLAVVGGALVAQGAVSSLLMFVSYALGMGVVLFAVAAGTAAFKGIVAHRLRGLLPYVERASGALLVAGGAYLIYYQAAYVPLAFGR